MKNTLFFFLTVLILLFFSCNKEDKSIPISDASNNQSNGSVSHTTFIFTGNMEVDKNDSLWVFVTNYTATNVTSTMFGTGNNFTLSSNFVATSLKGETNNNIPVNVSNNYFSTYNPGTGIFNQGVLNGFYSSDSLYYKVLYKGINKSNVYLTFKGELSNSY